MIIEPVFISGVYLLKQEPFIDERGTFSRMFCKRELQAQGLNGDIAQVNLSTNKKKGTLRGMHYQLGDDAEDKIVTCVSGSVFDVCVDVRENSPTYGKWFGETLSSENKLALYIPKGFAHGYLTLTGDAHVLYFVTQFYKPGAEKGYRFDEPLFNIEWLLPPPYIVSEKDLNWEIIGM